MFTDSEGRLLPAWSFLLSAGLCAVAFVAIGYLADTIAGPHVLRFEILFRTSLAALLLAGFSWLLTVANHVESHQIAAQGLPLSATWRREFALGATLAFVLVAGVVVILRMTGGIAFHVTLTSRSVQRVVAVIFVLLAGALAEELMFRGYPFQRLVEAIGSGGAIAVFSILFALMHFLNPGSSRLGMWNTVVIGIALSLAYLRTRALWLPLGFHFAWNAALGVAFGLPVSGLRLFNVIVRATSAGPKWLTGGSYGPEASVPGAIAVLLGLVVIWRAPLRALGKTAATPVVTNPPQRPPDLRL